MIINIRFFYVQAGWAFNTSYSRAQVIFWKFCFELICLLEILTSSPLLEWVSSFMRTEALYLPVLIVSPPLENYSLAGVWHQLVCWSSMNWTSIKGLYRRAFRGQNITNSILYLNDWSRCTEWFLLHQRLTVVVLNLEDQSGLQCPESGSLELDPPKALMTEGACSVLSWKHWGWNHLRLNKERLYS